MRIDPPPQTAGTWESEPNDAAARLVRLLVQRGISGFGPFKSAEDSAREALKGRTAEEAVKALIRSHCLAAGGQGFATGFGGIVAMPLTLPANIGASYLVQAHLAASIARVYGWDEHSDEVRAAILLCLVGNAGSEMLKRIGIPVGKRYAAGLLSRLPGASIRAINRRVGFQLLAKQGTKRASVTLAKGVPLVGGLVGGGVDLAATRAVGHFADRFFRPETTA
ncbi:MAG: EcsC family protein [Sporichthyaceae bacterium]